MTPPSHNALCAVLAAALLLVLLWYAASAWRAFWSAGSPSERVTREQRQAKRRMLEAILRKMR